jgi:hypothetical protein
VDVNEVVYANSEDGNPYVVRAVPPGKHSENALCDAPVERLNSFIKVKPNRTLIGLVVRIGVDMDGERHVIDCKPVYLSSLPTYLNSLLRSPFLLAD